MTYRVHHSLGCYNDFATFDAALEFYRRLNAQQWRCSAIVNLDRLDLETDGLTEAQREAVDLVVRPAALESK